jgi:DNA-directed RNA polymerase specialized sigma24 family protein
MRRRLVGFFERKRCDAADDLADETLNRVARRLAEEGAITAASPAHYCYIVARFVFLEHWRDPQRKHVAATLDASPAVDRLVAPTPDRGDEIREELMRCLEHCLDELLPGDRQLILEYYQGERQARIRHRRDLAVRLALTANALAIRASRIRHTLEACVAGCSGAADRSSRLLSHQRD